MKRQRTKEELLKQYKFYKAVQKDSEKDEDSREAGGVSYWRTSVEWIYALWKTKRLRKNVLANIINYVNDNIDNMTEEKRQQIRSKMDFSNWILKNQVKKKKCKNIVEQNWNNFEYYNTEVCTDYSMLVVEWLIDNKQYGKTQIDDLLVVVAKIDKYPSETIFSMRDDIYKQKGIWLEFTKQDTEEYFSDTNSYEINNKKACNLD